MKLCPTATFRTKSVHKQCDISQIVPDTVAYTDGKCDLENCHGSSLPDKSFVIYGK